MNDAGWSLRARLRHDTRDIHDELDTLVSQFDLTSAAGLAGFLQMQVTAMRALDRVAADGMSHSAMYDLRERAVSDLDSLGVPVETGAAETEAQVHPLAVDYAIAGSRLGTQVLKQRWQQSTDPQVAGADAYFTAPSYIDLWKAFCSTTGAMPGTGAEAEQIVGDANGLFALYARCARAALPTETAHA